MGKYNKEKTKQIPKKSFTKRFCPKCRWQSFEWKCPVCGTPTRRVNLQGTVDGISSSKEKY
jgi:predicted RNA-binding Zn-ribbon protein involved in translation (DUF1610 family)